MPNGLEIEMVERELCGKISAVLLEVCFARLTTLQDSFEGRAKGEDWTNIQGTRWAESSVDGVRSCALACDSVCGRWFSPWKGTCWPKQR